MYKNYFQLETFVALQAFQVDVFTKEKQRVNYYSACELNSQLVTYYSSCELNIVN